MGIPVCSRGDYVRCYYKIIMLKKIELGIKYNIIENINKIAIAPTYTINKIAPIRFIFNINSKMIELM